MIRNDRQNPPAVQRPRLPGCQLLSNPVGDPADQVPRHLHPIDLAQVGADLPGGQALGIQAHNGLVEARHPAGVLGHDQRLELAVTVPRDLQRDRPDLG